MNRSEAGKLGYEKTKEYMDAFRDEKSTKAKEKYSQSPKECPICKNSISYEKRENKFCSHSCSAKHNNTLREKRKKKCIGCDNLWEKNEKNRHNKYCSQCILEWKFVKRITSTVEAKCDSTRRDILLRTRPHKCSECNKKEWNKKPIPLQLHHIDGDPTNNKEENLCLICPNCHAQTDSFGGKNRGKGRAWRYKTCSTN